MKTWPSILARLVLGGVFIVAGAVKVVDPLAFARGIVDYDLTPELFVPALAVVLPWWEVLAGGLAIAGRWRLGALGSLTLMSVVFLGVGVITLARGLSPECACFGFMSERVGALSVGLEALLLFVTVMLLHRELRTARAG
jgi:hypothetical protein